MGEGKEREGEKGEGEPGQGRGGEGKRVIREGKKEEEGNGKEKEREEKGRRPGERTYFASVKIKSWVRPR